MADEVQAPVEYTVNDQLYSAQQTVLELEQELETIRSIIALNSRIRELQEAIVIERQMAERNGITLSEGK